VHGGRFNAKGRQRFISRSTQSPRSKEASQGFARKFEPCVLCTYEVDCEDVVDLRSEVLRAAAGVARADMAQRGSPKPPAAPRASQRLAKRLIAGARLACSRRAMREAQAPATQSRAVGLARPPAASSRRLRSERSPAEECARLALSLSLRCAPARRRRFPHPFKDVPTHGRRQFIITCEVSTRPGPAARRCSKTSTCRSIRTPRSACSRQRLGQVDAAAHHGGARPEFTGEGFLAEGARVGYLPQEPHLDPDLGVRGNVMLGVKEKQALLGPLQRAGVDYSDGPPTR